MAQFGETRLDVALAQRGLAPSRSQGARYVEQGWVSIDGQTVFKPAARVAPEQTIEVSDGDHYVSRGARKLLAALDAFPVTVTGRLCLDVGASTGGFSQVLLERDATQVIAVDVGHGQLDARLAAEPRLRYIEGVNVRYLTAEKFREISGSEQPPQLVVADLSFISLGLVLPALHDIAAPDADFVLLVKPQFEVGRQGVSEGIVRDPARRAQAITDVLDQAWALGLGTTGLIPSPIPGMAGNYEFLAWLNGKAGTNPTEWSHRVAAIV